MWEKNYTYSIGVAREYLVNILADSLKIPEDKNSFSRSDLNKSESILNSAKRRVISS